MEITVKKVEVLGCPVGNLWDVFWDGIRVGRVTYHGDSLVCVSGMVGKKAIIERKIAELYN